MTNKGFTLIETIIYIALLSIIIGGALVTAYGLMDGSQNVSTKTAVHEEGNFVLRKIIQIVGNTINITTPSALTPYSNTLVVMLNDGSAATIRFNTTNNAIEIQRGSGAFIPLTSTNVKVENLHFGYLAGSTVLVCASTTINGFLFETTRRLHY